MLGELLYLRDVTTLRLDIERCVGCGLCTEVCPHAVLALNGRKAAIRRRDACMECGACARNCPVGAIDVQAGVGCAQAVINTALGRHGDSCCCVLEPSPATKRERRGLPRQGTGCC